MSFSLAMYFKPDYQKRYGTCQYCQQGIEAGDRIMIGTGYWNKCIIKKRYHHKCFEEAFEVAIKDWFFKNNYKPTAMGKDKKAELNRLRARRYYIRQKGGEANVVNMDLVAVEAEIALVKAR